METEQSLKKHLTQLDFEEREEILETNRLHQILKRSYFCGAKPLKGKNI